MRRSGIVMITTATVSTLVAVVIIIVFCLDIFVIKGDSMEPYFHNGGHVVVNKLIFGARIYKNYNFNNSVLKSFRMPRLRDIRRGDVVVFNYPYANNKDTINFKINYVFLKRCYGAPGDSVVISNGFYKDGDDYNIGPHKFQNVLNALSCKTGPVIGISIKTMENAQDLNWTIMNYGPLYIPGKGSIIKMDKTNYEIYNKMIQYETGFFPTLSEKGIVYLGKNKLSKYAFTHDWYFFGGDNVLDSIDSRYFGLVPDDYIIGVATYIIFSKNSVTHHSIICRNIKKMSFENNN